MKRIGLIGVPIETVQFEPKLHGRFGSVDIYFPGITEESRASIIRAASQQGIIIEDLGEVCLQYQESYPFQPDRKQKVSPVDFDPGYRVSLLRIEEARQNLMGLANEYNLLVATGPSHLGALVLYAKGDRVARCDYHPDYERFWLSLAIGYATYLSWVKKERLEVEITNYFLMMRPDAQRDDDWKLGKDANKDDESYRGANHFDIDADVFDPQFQIQDVHIHHQGPSGVTPQMIETMICEAEPHKIGFWEYRPLLDYRRVGLQFIVNSIKKAIGNGE